MSRQQQNDLDFVNVSRILNLPDGASPQEPATVAQLNAAVEGLAWKDSVRVASTANINLAAPGSTVDGVTMSVGDRFLVKNQTAGEENGIYIWNGAAVAATRAPDTSTFPELEQAVVTVEEGTSAGASFRQTAVNGTLGTTTVSWSAFGTSAPAATETTAGISEEATQTETNTGTATGVFVSPAKLANWSGRKLVYSVTFGDGSATQFTITHNLGTRSVLVGLYRDSGAYDEVNADVEHTTTNTVTLRFASAPTAGQYTAVILG
jgi:hypothetical protein